MYTLPISLFSLLYSKFQILACTLRLHYLLYQHRGLLLFIMPILLFTWPIFLYRPTRPKLLFTMPIYCYSLGQYCSLLRQYFCARLPVLFTSSIVIYYIYCRPISLFIMPILLFAWPISLLCHMLLLFTRPNILFAMQYFCSLPVLFTSNIVI